MLDTADSPLPLLIKKVFKLFDALDKDVLQKFLSMLLFLIPPDNRWDFFPCSQIVS